MQRQSTPGPWHVDPTSQQVVCISGCIADVGDGQQPSEKYSPSIGLANARLIAAAPDMLAALHLTVERLESAREELRRFQENENIEDDTQNVAADDADQVAVELARAVIAKAEGR